MAREIKTVQNYQDRLLKLIPSEIVGAYIFLQGVIPQAYARWGTTVVAFILLVMTPLYLNRIQKVKRADQVMITTISFVVWLYSLGGPFQFWGLYEAWISSVILVLWTLAVPLFFNPRLTQMASA
jgi:magnesium-transporting ATPase (P-type)